ncbi:UDP-galactopyranose mutase [Enterococcus quebecensis]|uniref:UDP-galactopyranose mutase n=1 Tax=Enterococcus quebecensis TaxID=903983 RepID=A0A1E5GR90_9ENTE|nr:UDP-galactopyranose mutase [Enterococcus quebecensis]OEG15207.1 UDP-galactopyranose mutase [Enterococcus quebecensis]OJG74786.1 UDP-galactopuranose mutase [Enterococcus quebecensis]
MYDYLVVGAGLFGATFAYEAAKRGKRIKVIEKRNHIAGNIFTEEIEGIQVHKYGAHIFHTDNKMIWEYVQQFAEFNRYTNSPVANFQGEIYNLPFNMNTFNKLWGVITPEEAKNKIDQQKLVLKNKRPSNLEEQAISLVGTDIYNKLVKNYTEKQWGKSCKELPSFIIKRLPVRFTYDNNYFNDTYQGVPIGGYTQIVEKMLASDLIDVELETDFCADKENYLKNYPKVIYTGMIDQFYDYRFGSLDYRSLAFETKVFKDVKNFQGNAVVNYTDDQTTYTRVIEHKHFEFGNQPDTIVTWEYPEEWTSDREPYYPVNDIKNTNILKQYREISKKEENIIFGGRLGQYRYYDMHQVIQAALNVVNHEFDKNV